MCRIGEKQGNTSVVELSRVIRDPSARKVWLVTRSSLYHGQWIMPFTSDLAL